MIEVEKKQGVHKKLCKPTALVVVGGNKKIMVQAMLSPKKKTVPKGGNFQEKGIL